MQERLFAFNKLNHGSVLSSRLQNEKLTVILTHDRVGGVDKILGLVQNAGTTLQ